VPLLSRFTEWIRRWPALAFFLAAFLVYNLNLRPISSGDTAPAALLPLAVWLDGTITFDRWAPWLDQRYPLGAGFLAKRGAHYYSQYPILQPVLLLPLYSPLALVPGLREWPLERLLLLARVLEKLAASLIAACAVALFFCLVRRFTGPRHSLWLALLFAFATSTWSISSQALWQHGMGQLLIILSLLGLDRCLSGEGGRAAWVAAGLAAALSAGVRPTNVVFVAACCAVLLVARRWKALASYLLFGAVVGAAVAAHNLAVFGRLSGGYGIDLSGNLLEGLAGLLFSPSRGLFVYSPVFLFLLPAACLWLRRGAARGAGVIAIAALFSVAHVLVHAAWPVWWAGDCYGPRFLSEALPCLTLLLILALEWLEQSRPARAAFVALVAFSVFAQFVGAFSYPAGDWHATPEPVSRRPERFWDWKDNPVRRDFSAGVNLKGYRLLIELVAARAEGRPPDWEKLDLHIQ
jgi:hypothetical protein